MRNRFALWWWWKRRRRNTTPDGTLTTNGEAWTYNGTDYIILA